jgi:catalase
MCKWGWLTDQAWLDLQGTRTKTFVEQDDFYFPGKRYNGFEPDRQDRLAMRLAMKMTSKGVTEEIQSKWMQIWTKVDQGLADRITGHMKEMTV